MPPKTDDLAQLRVFFDKVVETASRGAESSTEVAGALRGLEDALKEHTSELRAINLKLDKVLKIEKRQEEEHNFMLLMLATLKNPQTVVLLLSIIAATLGIKISEPQQQTVPQPVKQEGSP